ncbi:MAG: methionyl-tRNA formyltransferase [Chitinophagaceae bacterium]|nr:methionyl-tRNA formyltransferase [Chitinophagaceae bacterium]
MGTPDFAVASLDTLYRSGCPIAGVVTAPDKPAGRGLPVSQSAVKKYALENNLKILQPEKLRAPQFLRELVALKADLQVVVAFRMLPEVVWNMPPMGTINLHGSLLPQYRGAAPINWALINGERVTGVTTFKLQHEIDTGNILLQETIIIGDDETAGDLYNRMKEIGAVLILKTVQELAEGKLKSIPQKLPDSDHQATLKSAPKLTTETCKIDWSKNVDETYNLIRGLSPYPAAFTVLNNKTLKIFKAEKEIVHHTVSPGEFETDKKTFLKFACKDGWVSVSALQLEGKKKMSTAEFLRGYHF